VTKRLRNATIYDVPTADPDPSKPWVRITGYVLAALYIALVVAEIIFSVTSSAQDAAFIKQIDAALWVVPTDDADDYLYFTQSPDGIFSLYSATDQNSNTLVICFGVFFLIFYALMAWKLPDIWVNFMPLVFGILFFGGVDVMVVAGDVFHMTTTETPIIQIDPVKKLLEPQFGPPLPLCGSGIRVVEEGGGRGGSEEDVELLEGGAIAYPAIFHTDDPAEALMALIQQTATASGCPIPANADWPESDP
jgi:hypothetical protein